MKKALIIIDMQEDFVNGTLGTPEARAIVPNVVNKLKAHENTDTVVLFTKDTHYDNYATTQEGQKLPVVHCQYQTHGWSIVKEIHDEFKHGRYATYSTGNVVNGRVLKTTFGSKHLADLLHTLRVDEIELCGVCTDICVVSNALLLKAAFPETKIIVDASCCAGVTPESHQAALTTMKMCQVEVINDET